MEKIEPKYISFEQAKWLKEINCIIECNQGYDFRGGDVKHMGRYISSHLFFIAPEQWQVVEWLRTVFNIDIQDICHYSNVGVRTYRIGIIYIRENKIESVFLRPDNQNKSEFIEFSTPQEGISAAFDYIRNNNLS